MCNRFKHPRSGWILSGRNKRGQVRVLPGASVVIDGEKEKRTGWARWTREELGDTLEGFGHFEGNARIEKCGKLEPGGTVPEKGPWWRRQVVVVPATEVTEYSGKARGCLRFPVPEGMGLVAVKGATSFAVVTKPAPKDFAEKYGVTRVPLLAKLQEIS